MKNPLEYTLLEIDTAITADPEGPHRELAAILRWLHMWQQGQLSYVVERQKRLFAVSKKTAEKKEPRTKVDADDISCVMVEWEAS
jgi:hypothetical protein